MNKSITFRNFSTETEFLSLQNFFLRHDERQNPYETTLIDNVILEDFEIIVKEVNPITYEEDYVDMSFYNDFLYPAIDSLSIRYLEYLKKEFKNPIFLDNEKVVIFARKEKEKLEKLNESIKKSQYLPESIIEKLEIQIEILIEKLSEIFIHPNTEIEEKLKFKMGKDLVILLFAMLRDKKIIDSPHNVDLGRFIDNNIMYWNNQEESYKHIAKANKIISDLKSGNKPCEKGLNKIKKILTDESFYHYPI